MGDISSPKRRDVFERLRRRIDLYKRQQNNNSARYDNSINTLYERGRQETLLLRDRWLQSKAKKASKSKKDNSSGEQRNLGVTKLLKKKIDTHQTENTNTNLDPFEYDDSDTITTRQTVKSGNGVDVSVRIVQEITGGTSQVQTNVAVSTTVKTHFGSSASDSKENTSVDTNTTTKVECKKEPDDDITCADSNQSDLSNSGSNILDNEELEEILTSIERDRSNLPEEIFNELEEFDRIYNKVSQEDSNDSTMFGSMTRNSPSLHKQPPFETGNTAASGSMFESQAPTSTRTPPVAFRTTGAITTMTETGPAAETLKQLAAQHQNQHHNGSFAGKQFSSHEHAYNNFPHINAPPYNHPQSFNNQQNVNNMHNSSVYHEASPDMFSGTKPLTHYAGGTANKTPSSLQQLQNQVQSFTQSPQLEITQSQHMQVNDGSRRLQMSQTQHMHMCQPPQNISLSQQQSFSMPNNMNQRQSPGYMADQMKMQQMYQEKMRQDQRHQAAQMQQFMRPPPEYKMQHQHSAPEGYPNSARQNPLQTMQDMVEQTSNNRPAPSYSNVKTENPPHVQGGLMQSAQMASVQRGSASSTAGPVMNSTDSVQAGYHMGHMQRQQSYPGAQMDASQMARQNRQSAYSSAIMRNQRPPNVNVGPDGLNISQPRSQDWPRHMMAQNQNMNGIPRPPNPNMMYGNTYPGTSVPNGQIRQMTAMQSQAAMMQSNAQAQHMMMQQQQGMQMSQRMGMPNTNNSTYNHRPQQDDFMNIIDSAPQTGGSDFIDNMAAQNNGVNSDAAWLEEILSGNTNM